MNSHVNEIFLVLKLDESLKIVKMDQEKKINEKENEIWRVNVKEILKLKIFLNEMKVIILQWNQ